MAQTVTETYRVSFKCLMQNDIETNTRTVSFDSFKQDTTALTAAATAISQRLVSDYNKFIQPTGWRDSDYTEDEWTTISVTPTIEHNIEIKLEEILPTP